MKQNSGDNGYTSFLSDLKIKTYSFCMATGVDFSCVVTVKVEIYHGNVILRGFTSQFESPSEIDTGMGTCVCIGYGKTKGTCIWGYSHVPYCKCIRKFF